MISRLVGTVKESEHNYIILDVSGVGFQVYVPDIYAYTQNNQVELCTYLHWNQENGPQIYGFSTPESRVAFGLIISCSGFGPRIGLAILAALTPNQFFEAITLADQKALSAISGVGPKKAENLIVQLKDKIAKLPVKLGQAGENNTLGAIKQVSEALASLHYTRPEISQALEYVKKNFALESSSFDDILRKSLAYLSKH